nr:hypothetical protein [Polyangiaceae bacterium]
MKRLRAAIAAKGDEPRRSPAEQKRLDYERQGRGFSEYHHALRHGKWRRKRRAVQKAYRHEVATQLALGARLAGAGPGGGGAAVERTDVDVGAVRRKRKRKWGPSKLGAWVEGRRERRIDFVAANYFKTTYRAELHCAPFAAFLASVVAGRGPGSIALARRFGDLLSDGKRAGAPAWLEAFLRDEPAWRPRLAAWIEALSA